MQVVARTVGDTEVCPYLGDRPSRTEYRVLLDVSPPELEHLLDRGWRRFGPVYFRPSCRSCAECVSLRIVAPSFRPSRGQVRARRAADALRAVVATPRVDRARLELHHAWHRDREERHGWAADTIDARRYAVELAFPHAAARELAWYDGDTLVGVALFDATRRAVSAIYAFHDPAFRRVSLGTASIVWLVEHAVATGRDHVHLGYRIAACASSNYKARFRPHELLAGRPGDDDEPRWDPAS